MCVYVCCLYVHICVQIYMPSQLSRPEVFAGYLLLFVSDRVSHWTASSLFPLGQLFTDARGLPVSIFSALALRCLFPHPAFVLVLRIQSQGLMHAYYMPAHPLDHFPSPSRFLFSKMFLKVVKVYFRTPD